MCRRSANEMPTKCRLHVDQPPLKAEDATLKRRFGEVKTKIDVNDFGHMCVYLLDALHTRGAGAREAMLVPAPVAQNSCCSSSAPPPSP